MPFSTPNINGNEARQRPGPLEKLYKHISTRIRQIYPNFNIGESTGKQRDWANAWKHPYRHWNLIPKDHKRDKTKAKP